MALNGISCAHVPLRNYSITHSLTHFSSRLQSSNSNQNFYVHIFCHDSSVHYNIASAKARDHLILSVRYIIRRNRLAIERFRL